MTQNKNSLKYKRLPILAQLTITLDELVNFLQQLSNFSRADWFIFYLQ